MNIIASYDTTLSFAPPGLEAAVQAACNYFDQMFTNSITVNIKFRYAPISGGGQSDFPLWYDTYTSVISALEAHAAAVQNAYGDYSLSSENLPSTDPFASDNGFLNVSTGEAKALGLNSNVGSDGTVTLNSREAWNFATNGDAVSVIEHEISEVLGRADGVDGSFFASPEALFRYSSPGVIDTSSSYANAYLSLDAGVTNLGAIGKSGGDLADWGASIADDSFGYGAGTVSLVDLKEMSAIGYVLNYSLLSGATVAGNNSTALVVGTAGSDTLSSSSPTAFIYGAGGANSIALGASGQIVDLNAPGIFNNWSIGQGFDTITGFQSGNDHLAIDLSAYGLMAGGYKFFSGTGIAPTTQQPTFYFDTATDYLWFDPDGSGSKLPDLVAFFPGVANLNASDLVASQVSFASGASIINSTPGTVTYGEGQNETLWATGSGETLIGGPSRDQFIAQAKNDIVFSGDAGSFVAGLGGNDTLAGGSGADTFYFASPSAGADTIMNFNPLSGDTIDILGSAFRAPSGFRFTDGVGFVQGAGATALAQTATFAYDTSTAYLWYDPDGTGPSTRSLVAFFPQHPNLDAATFVVT